MGLRRDVIMKSAYDYPAIVKNEIEYMHYKLHKFDQDSDLLENPKYLRETRFQKHFQMGEIAGKYQQMLQDQTGLDLKNNKIKKQPQKRRFEVVVEGGQVYFKCIDKFEEIFEISQEALGGQPIVEVLDPFTFDNHKEIIDALFEVYHDLSEQYLESGKPQSQDAIEGNLFEKATKKLRIKHGLVDDNSVQKPNSQLQIDTKTALKDELDAQKLASFKE